MEITLTVLIILSLLISTTSGKFNLTHRSPGQNLCTEVIQPVGYPCTERTIQTKDGYLLALDRVSSRNGNPGMQRGPPVLLVHGIFMAGEAWLLNSPETSLLSILADQGFDVWIGNVRGTFWSYGHVSLSEKDKEFWDWTWQELALYDLSEMIHHIYSTTNSKILIVGHSQGSMMSLAALTQPNIVEMVEAAAFLCPISYLKHFSAPLATKLVSIHLDEIVLAMGIHQLNIRSETFTKLLNSICDGHVDCKNLLSSVIGKNCCLNSSSIVKLYTYEPHPTSAKNMAHLCQMIRQGTFSKYDYGRSENLKLYGQEKPPEFDLSLIPKSFPLWMGYGGYDAVANVTDVENTIKKFQTKPELLYIENYGHIDFLMSGHVKEDVYNHMIGFFRSLGKSRT
ncbi:triacylglycerol lipase 1-like [Hevea brasiliensis]|uniref:triacylglycerol lipase 1-like n=1 Tax=Hevea brasiliensis TaxID=3981 RepID=UPI000B788296|nr:triacylglycerol lipase 1-like [Hevea brasiliensis]